jgi:type I restriction enzyme, S subunit
MSEWKETTLGNFLTFQRGFDITKKQMAVDGDYDVIFSSGIGGKHNEYKVEAPGVVIGRKGTLGTIFYSESKFWATDTTLWVKDFHGNHPKFAYYFLHTLKLGQYDCGSANPTLNRNHIHLLDIEVPVLVEEQKKIADILSCIDAKINNLRRQNETLEEIARSIFKHWFIDFEFPNPDGKPYKSSGGAMVRSDLGDIPEGWRVGKLGDVVSVNSQSIDKNYPHHIIEYVDISSVGIGTLENTTQYKLAEAPSRARRLVEHGDVIWSGVRPNRKSYLFICKPIDNLIVSTGFVVLSPKKIPSSYIYSWVTTSMFVDYLTLNASGSAYPAIKAEHFEIADIILPSISILDKFHLLIDPMRIKTHDNSLQIQTLTKTRDALLPKLMSGQLRVSE